MKKNILSLVVALMVVFTSISAPISAFAVDDSNGIRNEEYLLDASPRSSTIIYESGYFYDSGTYYSAAANSSVYINQTFTIIVNFKQQNSSGSATLKIGNAFKQTIPCDGVSRAYTITATFYDGPITWEIENHPADMAYVVNMYTP